MAILLMTLTLGAILVMFSSSRYTSAMLKNRMVVLNHLRAKIEGAKSAPYSPIVPYVDYHEDNDHGAYTIDDTIVSDGFSKIEELVDISGSVCKRVTVILDWTELRQGTAVNMTESLVTLMADHN